jgi:hypothetical protein
VSTILEALRERDGQGRLDGGEPIAWGDDPARMRWRWPAAAIVGLVAIGTVLHPLRWKPPPPPPSSAAPSIVVQQPVRPAPPLPRDMEEAPRARVERWKPTAAPPPPSGVAADVALAIDGAPSVILRQGESAGGVEVQLILPGAVYVRRGPDVFALGTVR